MDESTKDVRVELAEASAWFSNPPPHYSAIWRWAQRGLLARNGERVRLKSVRLGRKLYTTRRWYEEFIERKRAADLEYFQSRDALEHDSRDAERRELAPIGSGGCAPASAELERQLAAEGL